MSGASGYVRRLVIGAPSERVFDAIATVDGPRHWWTTKVTGSAAAGGELRFGFAGLDEQMVMRVSASQRPSTVEWSCVKHTRANEWTGTLLQFRLLARGPGECELEFRHSGLPAELVAEGWEHFLSSLAAYAETGTGTPFGQ
ncbi:MAG TPA: SRPBCC domain-containing protein [Streptosporangiaceae bacterium]